jgi:hypothetical protein
MLNNKVDKQTDNTAVRLVPVCKELLTDTAVVINNSINKSTEVDNTAVNVTITSKDIETIEAARNFFETNLIVALLDVSRSKVQHLIAPNSGFAYVDGTLIYQPAMIAIRLPDNTIVYAVKSIAHPQNRLVLKDGTKLCFIQENDDSIITGRIVDEAPAYVNIQGIFGFVIKGGQVERITTAEAKVVFGANGSVYQLIYKEDEQTIYITPSLKRLPLNKYVTTVTRLATMINPKSVTVIIQLSGTVRKELSTT